MLYETLSFLVSEVNQYLDQKLSTPTTDPRLKIGNVARVLDDAGSNSLKDKAVLSLVNIEEDRVFKQHENATRGVSTTVYKRPPLQFNLYVLFSVNRDDYKDSLVLLGYIMQFFQHHNCFTSLSHPRLDNRIKKLIVDLYTMNFEQVNHLWSTLGGKYLPCALYKVRQIVLDENATIGEAGFIKEIGINSALQHPAS
jgi:hypothetical protein